MGPWEKKRMIDLATLGWGPFFQEHWDREDRRKSVPARVIEEQKKTFRVAAETGVMLAVIAGTLRHNAAERADLPAVGDWVSVQVRAGDGRATINQVLPRRTKFSRKVAGEETSEQIVAANIDTVFLVSSLNADLNLRRIERYVATVWESGARPVILLNKADLVENPYEVVEDVAAVAAGVPIHVISAHDASGINELKPYLQMGQTIALLGSSGVGKSTLTNLLLGADVQAVRAIREVDDRGRHTTSFRKLFVLPQGGVLIDTPGMRELQLWDVDTGLGQAFADIAAIAESCRFRNCKHESEPDCAVRRAMEAGELDADRFESYLELRREAAHLTRKQDIAARTTEHRRVKTISKAMKLHYKLDDSSDPGSGE